MLKIGEFSKMSQLTVKALRFYEKEGLLLPAAVDSLTGYRMYETSQLAMAARIRTLRHLGFSLGEIKMLQCGADIRKMLAAKAAELEKQRSDLGFRLTAIKRMLEEDPMKYRVEEKTIPSMLVYCAETTLESYGDAMEWIPALGQRVRELNPSLTCANPPYEFCEYLDGEYRDRDVRIRHSEAIEPGEADLVGDEVVSFRTIPTVKVLSVEHRGAYEQIGQAYSFLMEYAESNGYECAGLARESYIDGIWNKDSVDEWLTEIQLPVK